VVFFILMKRKWYLIVLLVVIMASSGCNEGDSSDQLLELDLLEDSEERSEEKSEEDSHKELEEPVNYSPVFVHVCGAVKQPGVYELAGNRRVFEAVELAGGLSEDAAVSYINLARVVEDGERLYVPTLDEIAKLKEGGVDIDLYLDGDGSIGDLESSGKVNINQAGLEELMTLSGIGPSKARSIIDYREQQGRYNSVEELMNVSGIGASTFEKIKDSVIL
jgi:competence protein ComEA